MRQRKRVSFRDRYRLGKSDTVPYISNESWNERHQRRKDAALERKAEVDTWCRKNKWTIRIANNGHHWIFKTVKLKMVEWFPSSGKLVIGKQWRKGIHIHDVDQLLLVLEICVDEEKEEAEEHSYRSR